MMHKYRKLWRFLAVGKNGIVRVGLGGFGSLQCDVQCKGFDLFDVSYRFCSFLLCGLSFQSLEAHNIASWYTSMVLLLICKHGVCRMF